MISAVIMSYNEEQNIAGLMGSLEGLDDIVFIDNGSTDDTAKFARAMGATVILAGDGLIKKYQPTAKDIVNFSKKFGWAPEFNISMRFGNYSEIRNYGAFMAKNDWVFAIDCDERVEWELDQLKLILPNFDVITYPSIHSETEILYHQKFYNKRAAEWNGWYHEYIRPIKEEQPLRTAHIHDGLKVYHYQRPRRYRSRALATLEYADIVEDNPRSLFYLGREYGGIGEHNKAITVLTKFVAEENSEFGLVNESLVLLGISHHAVGLTKMAREFWLTALERNPEFKDPYRLLGMTAPYKEHQLTWERHANIATNDNVFFNRGDNFWKNEEA